MKCPVCGKFLKNVIAQVNGFKYVLKVEGQCKTHGNVEPTDWEWDDFYPPTRPKSEHFDGVLLDSHEYSK